MLFVLCCTAARTVGLLKRRVEVETELTVTVADDMPAAMERLRAQAAAKYGERIGAWSIELNATEIPASLCVLTAIQAFLEKQRADMSNDGDAPHEDGPAPNEGDAERVSEGAAPRDIAPEASDVAPDQNAGAEAPFPERAERLVTASRQDNIN